MWGVGKKITIKLLQQLFIAFRVSSRVSKVRSCQPNMATLVTNWCAVSTSPDVDFCVMEKALWCQRGPAVFNSVCQNPRSHTASRKRGLQPTTQARAELVHGGHKVQPVVGVVPDTCTASRIETHRRPKCPSSAANLLVNDKFQLSKLVLSLLLVPEPPTTHPATQPTTSRPPPSTYQSTQFTSVAVPTGRRTSI